MVTGTLHASRWLADVASLVAGVAAPAIVLAVAKAMTLETLLLLAVWMVVPLHAAGRVLADVRHGLARWSAARAGARAARHITGASGTKERASLAGLTTVTQDTINQR